MRKREGQVSKMKDYFKKLGEGGGKNTETSTSKQAGKRREDTEQEVRERKERKKEGNKAEGCGKEGGSNSKGRKRKADDQPEETGLTEKAADTPGKGRIPGTGKNTGRQIANEEGRKENRSEGRVRNHKKKKEDAPSNLLKNWLSKENHTRKEGEQLRKAGEDTERRKLGKDSHDSHRIPEISEGKRKEGSLRKEGREGRSTQWKSQNETGLLAGSLGRPGSMKVEVGAKYHLNKEFLQL